MLRNYRVTVHCTVCRYQAVEKRSCIALTLFSSFRSPLTMMIWSLTQPPVKRLRSAVVTSKYWAAKSSGKFLLLTAEVCTSVN